MIMVSFHDFKSQDFKSSVSNPKSKYVAYVSVLSQISNCQGLSRKNQHEILKTDCNPLEQAFAVEKCGDCPLSGGKLHRLKDAIPESSDSWFASWASRGAFEQRAQRTDGGAGVSQASLLKGWGPLRLSSTHLLIPSGRILH